jgi:hypothetical protein
MHCGGLGLVIDTIDMGGIVSHAVFTPDGKARAGGQVQRSQSVAARRQR